MKRKDVAGLLVVAGIVSLGSNGAKAEADVDPVVAKDTTRTCAGCHGIPDYRIAFPQVYSVPRIGGQEADYMAKALEGYRAGTRKHPAMNGIAGSLTDKDIAAIVSYYSTAAPQAHGETDESGRKKAESSCDGCHGKPGAKPVMPGAPKLAGQQYDYLMHSLRAFRGGERPSPIMGAVAKPLTDEDIRALSRYYSTAPGLSAKY